MEVVTASPQAADDDTVTVPPFDTKKIAKMGESLSSSMKSGASELKKNMEHMFHFGGKYEEQPSLHEAGVFRSGRTASTLLLSLGAASAVIVSLWAVAGLRRGARANRARTADGLLVIFEDPEGQGLVLDEAGME